MISFGCRLILSLPGPDFREAEPTKNPHKCESYRVTTPSSLFNVSTTESYVSRPKPGLRQARVRRRDSMKGRRFGQLCRLDSNDSGRSAGGDCVIFCVERTQAARLDGFVRVGMTVVICQRAGRKRLFDRCDPPAAPGVRRDSDYSCRGGVRSLPSGRGGTVTDSG
jgi:hypothetical protein